MAIDARLGDYETRPTFAAMVGKSTRTISRWTALPDGLPYVRLGNEVLIPIPEAREWIARRLKRPNPRRRAHHAGPA